MIVIDFVCFALGAALIVVGIVRMRRGRPASLLLWLATAICLLVGAFILQQLTGALSCGRYGCYPPHR